MCGRLNNTVVRKPLLSFQDDFIFQINMLYRTMSLPEKGVFFATRCSLTLSTLSTVLSLSPKFLLHSQKQRTSSLNYTSLALHKLTVQINQKHCSKELSSILLDNLIASIIPDSAGGEAGTVHQEPGPGYHCLLPESHESWLSYSTQGRSLQFCLLK